MTSAIVTTLRESSRRLPLVDNARFLAVTLVVIGHAIQRLTDNSNSALTLYIVIYAFHIPAFSLISGYFSRSDPPNIRSMTRTFTDLIVPYFVMEAAWSILKFLIDGDSGFDPTKPSWTLWFLLSLATFRVILPYLALLRWPLIISMVISVGAGYLGGVDNTFSLARTLGFLPFFVLGWKLSQTSVVGWWLSLGRMVWWIRGGAMVLFASALMLVYANADNVRALDLPHWLFYDHSYADLGAGSYLAGGVRLALIAFAIALCAAFLSLVPRHATAITAMGTATMYVYLLHSFVLYPIRESDLLSGGNTSAAWLTVLIVGSVALSSLLASKSVRRVFRPIIQPSAAWLFRDNALEGEPSLPRVAKRFDRVSQNS